MEGLERRAPREDMGQTVKRYRELQGMSLQALSDLSGVSYTMLWYVEHGQRSLGVRSLGKLLPYLGKNFALEIITMMAREEGSGTA